MLEGTAATPKPGEVREAPAAKQFPMSDPVDDLSWLDDGNADFDFVDGQLVLKGKPEDTGNAPSPKPTEAEVKPTLQTEAQVATPNIEVVSELKEQIKMLQQGMVAILQKQSGEVQHQPTEQEIEIDWSDPSQVKAYTQHSIKVAVAEAIKPYQQGIHAAQVNNEYIAVQQKYGTEVVKAAAPAMMKILESVPEMSIEKAYEIARGILGQQTTKPQESTLESKTQQPKPAGDLIKKIASLTSEADLGRRATEGKDPNHLLSVDEAFDEAIATLVGRR